MDILPSELTKFSLVSTRNDFIEKLELKVATLEKEKRDHLSDLKGATTAATTATSKVNEIKEAVVV